MSTRLGNGYLSAAPVGARIRDKDRDIWLAVAITETGRTRWRLANVDADTASTRLLDNTLTFTPFTLHTGPAPTPTTEPTDPLAAFIAHTAAHPLPAATPAPLPTTPTDPGSIVGLFNGETAWLKHTNGGWYETGHDYRLTSEDLYATANRRTIDPRVLYLPTTPAE